MGMKIYRSIDGERIVERTKKLGEIILNHCCPVSDCLGSIINYCLASLWCACQTCPHSSSHVHRTYFRLSFDLPSILFFLYLLLFVFLLYGCATKKHKKVVRICVFAPIWLHQCFVAAIGMFSCFPNLFFFFYSSFSFPGILFCLLPMSTDRESKRTQSTRPLKRTNPIHRPRISIAWHVPEFGPFILLVVVVVVVVVVIVHSFQLVHCRLHQTRIQCQLQLDRMNTIYNFFPSTKDIRFTFYSFTDSKKQKRKTIDRVEESLCSRSFVVCARFVLALLEWIVKVQFSFIFFFLVVVIVVVIAPFRLVWLGLTL